MCSCTKKKDYCENLDFYKNLVSVLNTYYSDSTEKKIEISEFYANDFKFHYFPVGKKQGVEIFKDDYISYFRKLKNENFTFEIVHSIYMPGLDEFSKKIDGSVRSYYGAEISKDSNTLEFSGYQTINFKEGKISEIWEWADFSGVLSEIKRLKGI